MKHTVNNYTRPKKSLKGNTWYFLYATATVVTALFTVRGMDAPELLTMDFK